MKIIKKFLKGFQQGIIRGGQNISIIINTILLSFIYFMGIGTIFIIAKFKNKSFLDLELSEKGDSYWSKLSVKSKGIEDYYKQF